MKQISTLLAADIGDGAYSLQFVNRSKNLRHSLVRRLSFRCHHQLPHAICDTEIDSKQLPNYCPRCPGAFLSIARQLKSLGDVELRQSSSDQTCLHFIGDTHRLVCCSVSGCGPVPQPMREHYTWSHSPENSPSTSRNAGIRRNSVRPDKVVSIRSEYEIVSNTSVHGSQEDDEVGERQECLMNVRAPLVSNEQAAKTMQPGGGALDDPALASEALAALDHRAGDATADALHAQVKAVALGVVALVCVQLFGPPLRSADTSCDRLDPREHHAERRAVVEVGRGDVRRAEGSPCRSVTTWCLLPSRPRSVGLFPVSSPPFCRHRRRVEDGSAPIELLGALELIEQMLVKALPYAALLPFAQASPTRHAASAAHLRGELAPLDPRLQHEHDARERGAVVHARATSLRLRHLGRKQFLLLRPQRVRDLLRLHGQR